MLHLSYNQSFLHRIVTINNINHFIPLNTFLLHLQHTSPSPQLTCISVDTCILTLDDDVVELPGYGICQFLTPVFGWAEDQDGAFVLGNRLQAKVDHVVFVVLEAGSDDW